MNASDAKPARSDQLILLVGMGLQLAGLALDVVVHTLDHAHAEREGPATLTNPGHALFLLGLALAAYATAHIWTSKRATSGRAIARRIASVTIAGVLAITALSTAGHSHAADADTTVRHIGHGGAIHSAAETPITLDQLHNIDSQLAITKATTAKYRDVQLALRDGYQQEGPSLRGAGAHFVNRQLLDAGVFDVRRPTVLLYERQPDWRLELVGVAWFLPKQPGNPIPPKAFAPLAAWHYHSYPAPGICIGPRGVSNLVGSACEADQGRYWTESPWMLHAWLYRPSPNGVFSLVNLAVQGSAPAQPVAGRALGA